MKKILTFIFLLLLTVSFKNVSALEEKTIFVNNHGVNVTEDRFLELMDAGYTINDIHNMDLETYTNASTDNEDIAIATKYYKTTTTTRYGNTTTETEEVTEQEFNDNQGGTINMRASGTVETTYKKLMSSITSNTEYSYRMNYRTYMYWKTLPSVRSYDIIGMGFDSTVVNMATYPDFYQLYTQGGSTYTSTQAYVDTFNNGVGAVFELPTNVRTLCQDISFEVSRANGTVTRQETSGDYAHAIQTVNGPTVRSNYSSTTLGLSLYSAINSKYDAMSEATVIWEGTW